MWNNMDWANCILIACAIVMLVVGFALCQHLGLVKVW